VITTQEPGAGMDAWQINGAGNAITTKRGCDPDH
jgi:hypothetical protein